MKRIGIVALLVVFTAGCASDSWIYPVFNANDRQALITDGATVSAVPLTVDDARNLVTGLTQKLALASQHRDDAKLVLRELLFYGTLLAAGGVAAGSIAVRNVGGIIAGGSVTLDSHYQPTVQAKAFANAAEMMRCAQERLDPIDPALIDVLGRDVTSNVTADERSAYAAIPQQVRDYVQKISLKLQADLAAVQLAAPSRQEIEAAFKQADTANDKALTAANELTTQRMALLTDKAPKPALEKMKTAQKLMVDVETNVDELNAARQPPGKSETETKITGLVTQLKDNAAAAVSAASSAVALTEKNCQFNGQDFDAVRAADVKPDDRRRYRSCLIQEKTPAEQTEMAVAFVQATTKLASGLDLCTKSVQ